jgi:hypothetical protein
VKTDIRVVRMTAAVLSTMFGSLWIAFTLSAMVAPPEPEIATLGRRLCLALFILSTIWALALYAVYRAESHRKDAKDAKDQDSMRNGT